jgi:hypothetical protein
MEIELLYTPTCPSWRFAQDNLKAALAAEGVWVDLQLVPVSTPAQAADLKFLGSPTFRVNGKDLWPEARTSYILRSRLYLTPGGVKGWPTINMLRQRLRPVLVRLSLAEPV